MKLYTGFGDQGNTSLFGGEKVKKNNERVEAYGVIDELNSLIGLLDAKVNDSEIKPLLKNIQNELFVLSSEIATPDEAMQKKFKQAISENNIRNLEQAIDLFTDEVEPLKKFILPGGSEEAALSHLARTVCRRAERKLIPLVDTNQINGLLLIYLNRLSDLFFALARVINQRKGVKDIIREGIR